MPRGCRQQHQPHAGTSPEVTGQKETKNRRRPPAGNKDRKRREFCGTFLITYIIMYYYITAYFDRTSEEVI